MSFYGRKKELSLIENLTKKKTASLVVLRGRRRIGKSRLVEQVGEGFKFLEFSGLAPEERVTAAMQRDDFAKQLQRVLNIPLPRSDDWGDLFWTLANSISNTQTLILLDEISWMGSKDPTFLPKLKTCWDTLFKRYNKLILVISGSASGWIEKNLLSSPGFMGRVSLDLELEELPLEYCSMFWGKYKKATSAYEKLKFLAVTGGVPRYLEELYPDETSANNIQRACFSKSGFLFNEFEKIFSDLFDKRAKTYKEIVMHLSKGPLDLNQIYTALDSEKSGTIIDYIEDLVSCGFIKREYTWSLATGKESKLSRMRLSDNYVRFYLLYILPYKNRILNNNEVEFNINPSIIGLQFENLVLANRHRIHELLEVKSRDIIANGPFFQKATKRQHGCQIDYMLQTKENILYICEIKFSQTKVKMDVIKEVESKIKAIKIPKLYSFRKVLIHVNGITADLAAAEYFSHMICFGDLL